MKLSQAYNDFELKLVELWVGDETKLKESEKEYGMCFFTSVSDDIDEMLERFGDAEGQISIDFDKGGLVFRGAL